MSSSNEYQAKEFVEDDFKEMSNSVNANPSIHSLISSGLVVPKLSSSHQNNIVNNDITSTLKDRIASIKSKLGSEASWNEIIGKHFISASSSNDTPHQYQKSIFEMCSEVEILLLLMNSDRVSKLTETLMMNKSSSTATHDKNTNTTNKVASHLKKRLANVHVEIESTLSELTQKMQLIEPVFENKFHNKYWEEESAQMATTTKLLVKTIKEQSDALDTRMKENEDKMMKAIDALKKRC